MLLKHWSSCTRWGLTSTFRLTSSTRHFRNLRLIINWECRSSSCCTSITSTRCSRRRMIRSVSCWNKFATSSWTTNCSTPKSSWTSLAGKCRGVTCSNVKRPLRWLRKLKKFQTLPAGGTRKATTGNNPGKGHRLMNEADGAGQGIND